jgi:hypothetical protein
VRNQKPFRVLVEMFHRRFFQLDIANAEGDFGTSIYQVLGFLALPGIFLSYFLWPSLMAIAAKKPGPATDWALRNYRLFFLDYSFAVTGFAAVFQWQRLFPNRQDFLVLASFPIRPRTLLLANFTALVGFLLLLVAAVNLGPTLMIPLVSLAMPQAHFAELWRSFAIHVLAIGGVSAFSFGVVAAVQGALITLLPPRSFRRFSPWMQMLGMSLMVIVLLLYPVYSRMLPGAAQANSHWLWFVPPIWFAGIYDLFASKPEPLFASLGLFAGKSFGFCFILLAVTWALGFQAHYGATLETNTSLSQKPASDGIAQLLQSPFKRALFLFTRRTLFRSRNQQLFLATYISVGISVSLLVTVIVRNGHIEVSPDGVRSVPFLMAFFVISGLRAIFQFPAELRANWLFRITESNWAEASRRIARAQVIIYGLIPVVLLMIPLGVFWWGWMRAAMHALFQFMAGALLIEIVFWRFDKVPFTWSYFAGKADLAIVIGLYIYGFTTYSFQMAAVESAVESQPFGAIVLLSIAAIALTISWKHPRTAAAVRFDAAEPHIQTLDLN